MSDIPEDIRAAAEALAADWFVEDAADWVDGILAEKLARDIARALLAGRNATIERCANLVEAMPPDLLRLPDKRRIVAVIASAIRLSAAIRSQAKE